MPDVLDNVAAWFETYAGAFLADETLRGVLTLKRDHCLRVLDECRGLTAAEGFDAALALACQASAILHDVGRFPQYRDYGTLRDALSVNHAVASCAIIEREGVLVPFDETARRLIRYAVVLHNRRMLPNAPGPELALAAKVLRDSDKLDIVRVMLGHFDLDPDDREAAFFGLEADPERYSPAMVQAVADRHMAGHAGMRFRNDFYLLVLSWAYDLNFAASRKLFMTRGYVDEIVDSLPRTHEIEKLRSQVVRDLTG